MAENNKKRIQRKLDKAKKKFEEKIKFRLARNLNALQSTERHKQRMAVLVALAMAERKMREQQQNQQSEYDFADVEKEIQLANDSMQRINEIDGVEEVPEVDGGEQERVQDRVGDEAREQVKDKVGDEVKKRVKEKLRKQVKKKVGKKIAEKGLKAAASVALKHPYVLVALALILLVILLIVGMVACSANKSYSEDGGSAFVVTDEQNPEHQSVISQVRIAASGDELILADSIKNDILGDNISKLDYRIVQTLAYLSSKYPIGVNILYSNAPDYTHRQNVSKEALELESEEKSLDATSAYKLGQAVGINSVGTVSAELADACDISGPVYVEWQEVALEGTTLPVYEQLQVDVSSLYVRAEGIASAGNIDVSEQIVATNVLIEQIKNNLNKLTTLEEGFSGIQGYATDSLGLVGNVSTVLNQGSWEDVDSELMVPVSTMVQRVFRIMQVANMDQWYGSTDNGCRMWKAFEARQNIRKLVLDVMRMPIELAGPEDEGFNNNFVVKQLIVYSPEDDLDNGPTDWDVFPPGITSVGTGGVAIGSSTGGDGIVDYRDGHFMSLPIDNGVFNKVCAEFVYAIDDINSIGAQATLLSLAPEGLRADMCRLLYGNERVSVEGEVSGLVSYKKFIHIGF